MRSRCRTRARAGRPDWPTRSASARGRGCAPARQSRQPRAAASATSASLPAWSTRPAGRSVEPRRAPIRARSAGPRRSRRHPVDRQAGAGRDRSAARAMRRLSRSGRAAGRGWFRHGRRRRRSARRPHPARPAAPCQTPTDCAAARSKRLARSRRAGRRQRACSLAAIGQCPAAGRRARRHRPVPVAARSSDAATAVSPAWITHDVGLSGSIYQFVGRVRAVIPVENADELAV